MKKYIIVAMVLFFACITVATAADVMTFENSKGTITFKHKEHQEMFDGDCSLCHEGTPDKFGIDRSFGHKTCKGCHKEMGGPTSCNDCHQKEAGATEQATREEIIEMSKKAEELLLTNREAGIAEIANKEGQFVWKNTYVFLMDFDGNMLAHPMIPQLTEKGPLFHVPDKNKENPKMIFVEFVDIAKKNGEGWLWYKWPKPNSREPADKFTYIRRVGFTDLLVGAGIYHSKY